MPFEEKEEAKRKVNARWDGELRLWYVAPTTERDKVARWLPPPLERSGERQ